ncbi:hypothetical protein [Mycobacterium aquaticum]|uniref:Uncharacterized protein n=1 Tax=Mycobacterium aquaticum TaxID=1927124 RepID=A0A1X0A250_9MYCO|nr:hypothetical protein [Mycobacterium aquaticum]ORA24163.1 hypothetical protein BST13_34455 [Mycobacterium aquaticum]
MDNDKHGWHSDPDAELPDETDQDLLDQLHTDLLELAELADAEADRCDEDVLAELEAHVQDFADFVNSGQASADRPLAQVINLADRRMDGRH